MQHCIEKIREIVERAEGDPRSIFQLGYNLGRLSEITGLGRGPFWDAWHEAVSTWDRAELRRLARELRIPIRTPRDESAENEKSLPNEMI